jgi:hypothetical protein
LAPPKHCTRLPFAVGRAGRIDVFGDGRRADKADSPDARIGEQRVDRFLVTIDDIEHARGKSSLRHQLAEPHRHRGVALRRLEDEGIAAGERRGRLPQGDHGRKVERRDTGHDAERLPE